MLLTKEVGSWRLGFSWDLRFGVWDFSASPLTPNLPAHNLTFHGLRSDEEPIPRLSDIINATTHGLFRIDLSLLDPKS